METIIKIELPLKRVAPPSAEVRKFLPRRVRLLQPIYYKASGAWSDLSGKKFTTIRIFLFRWQVLTIHRNEAHDRSDAERADYYLSEWSKCEKELRMFQLAALGAEAAPHVKQLIKDSFGVDLDEGTVR